MGVQSINETNSALWDKKRSKIRNFLFLIKNFKTWLFVDVSKEVDLLCRLMQKMLADQLCITDLPIRK